MSVAQSHDDLDDIRWEAVRQRQPIDGDAFVYAVRTTGVYCRPGCGSRTPRRENVCFFESSADACAAGYRACLRCHPDDNEVIAPQAELVIAGCRYIESCETPPTLNQMAEVLGCSTSHCQKLFRSELGVSPREYAAMTRVTRFAHLLKSSSTVLEAIYKAGYNTVSRCYSESNQTLGMSPDDYRKGGPNQQIGYAVTNCSLGDVLVATTELGICRIALGDKPSLLIEELKQTFPLAAAIDADDDWNTILQAVVSLIEGETLPHSFPLDIRGTAFQRTVWQALQKLPAGETVTYSTLAQAIGRPAAVRAVASACGANQLAVLIPCHRVIRADGGLGGYRWGLERKQKLLAREERES